jgi:hypothetical protein
MGMLMPLNTDKTVLFLLVAIIKIEMRAHTTVRLLLEVETEVSRFVEQLMAKMPQTAIKARTQIISYQTTITIIKKYNFELE